MAFLRLIARLDIKGPNLVKGVQLEGLRKLGSPNAFVQKYYREGIDEILYMDIVASLYGRDSLLNIVRETTQDAFIPITVGGGIRSLEDVRAILREGADKIAVNTGAVKRPALIHEISDTFGAQCVVLSIEAKRNAPGHWEVYYDNGREKTGMDVLEWAQQGYELGAGEILLTSVDQEGTASGCDIDLVNAVVKAVPIPVIACGGIGLREHISEVVAKAQPDAVAMANVLHYGKLSVPEIREHLRAKKIDVRTTPQCS